MSDLRGYHRTAIEVASALVGGVPADGLGVATPCGSWDLGRLLAHMTGQNHGFAAAARGEREDMGIWADRPVAAGEDPGRVFAASGTEVVAAFAAIEDLPGSRMWLPEVRPEPLRAEVAVGFQLVDTVVHAWDVAKSVGARAEFDADLLDVTLRIALAVPDGAERTAQGAAFAPGVAAPEGAAALDRIVAALGRDPHWAAPAG
ncbi:TIGR03086 family metal-binding protein [Streptomyces sp. NPDC088194]|uniref:TIGR03086 family metal-binding protein n=1 Tax=Streptomyces sp. NPDC088194 TaxID=3154931 RepID=UPI00344B8E20